MLWIFIVGMLVCYVAVRLWTKRTTGTSDTAPLLPSDIVAMMERFGRHEIDVMESGEDGYVVFQATQEPLLGVATTLPVDFIRELADACIPAGGWAVFGADRTVVNLIGLDPPGTDWHRILDASTAFLRANFVPPMRVPGYAWNRFVELGGTSNTWIELRDPPAREHAKITPLRPGEWRPVAKLGPSPDANLILVGRDGDRFVAVIDARYSEEDPTRSRYDHKSAADLYDLFIDVAWSTQVWSWCDAELELFFPAPKARI